MRETTVTVEPLWVESAARRFGCTAVADRLLDRPELGPYVFITAVVGFHLPVLSAVGWLRTGVLSVAANPGEMFQVVAWPAVVWMLLRTKRRYEAAVTALPDAIDDDIRALDTSGGARSRLLTLLGVPERPTGKADAGLQRIASNRVRFAVLGLGLAVYWQQLLTDPAALVEPVAALTGPAVAGVRFYLVIPFVLYPIGAEFLAVILGALVVLPFKIRRARLLDFSDPHRFGGLSPAGDLFKTVAVSYFVLLALFTAFQLVAVGTTPTNLFASALILSGLGLGLVLFFAPMFWLKSFVAAAKEAKVDALAAQMASVGDTDARVPYADPESADQVSRYTYTQLRVQQVDATSEFPFDSAMLQEVLFALLLPYVTSLAFDYLLSAV